jgi:photosystem II CP47 chlorophyll apoprotein
MHTALVAAWSAVMVVYELIVLDGSEPVYNPCWRQGSFVIPFMSRLGLVNSIYGWALGIDAQHTSYWTYETSSAAHLILAGHIGI